MKMGILFISVLVCLTVSSTGVAQEERIPSTPIVVFPEEDTKAPLDQATLELINKLHNARSIGDQEEAKRILDILEPREPVDMATPRGYDVYPTFEPQELERDTSEETNLKWLVNYDKYVMLSTSHEKSPTMETLWDSGGSPNMYIAAELWSGTSSPDRIFIKRSSNHGLSWSDYIWWNSSYALKVPKMKIVRPNYLGLVFDQEVSASDHNIWFTRNHGTVSTDTSSVGIDLTANDTYRPAITSDYEDFGSGSYIYVVYYQDDGNYSRIMFSRSTDGGLTWSTPKQIASLVSPDYPHIDIDYEDDTNTLWIAWTFKWSGTSNHDVAVQKSTDYGLNWSSATIVATASANETYPSIAASSSTCVHVAYEYDYVTDRDIRYAYTSNQGASWNTNYTLEGSLSDNRFPIIRHFQGTGSNLYCAYVTFPAYVYLRETLPTTPTIWSSRLNVKNSSLDVSDNDIVALLPKYDPFGGNDAAIAWPVDYPGYGYDIAMNAEWFDDSPPSPSTMYFTTAPYEISTSAISMVATTATDPTPPVEYAFNFTSSPTGGTGGTDSAWQTSRGYTDTGLQANHEYGYQVVARDGYGNMNNYSSISYDYTDIETPTGITFGIITSSSIQAKSTNTPSGLTRDSSGLVIYNYSNGTKSGWKQNNNYWTSSPLSPNTEYEFRALARNGDGNTTGYSPLSARYTLANPPGAAPFSDITSTSVRANWTPNGNPAPPNTYYYCENITKGTNSGWITNTSWVSDGLSPGTPYTFRVKAANGNGIETSWTGLGTVVTACPTPSVPSNPSPANGAAAVPITADLDWNDSAGATSYDVYFGTSSPPPFIGNVPGSFYNLGTLNCSTRYYWQIRAKNACGETPGPIWYFDTVSCSGWKWLTSDNPDDIDAGNIDSNIMEELIGDFGGLGLWARYNNTSWINLIGSDAYAIANGDIDSDGISEVVASFSSGTWTYDDFYGWNMISALSAESLACGDLDNNGQDEIIADFGSNGLQAFDNNTSWRTLTGDNAIAITTGDRDANNIAEVYASFGALGLWNYTNATGWMWMTSDYCSLLACGDLDNNGQDDLVAAFPAMGLWSYFNNSGWMWMTSDVPTAMAFGDVKNDLKEELVGGFPGLGMYIYEYGTAWAWLTGDVPENIACGDFGNDGKSEIAGDFGGLGVWVYK